MMKVGFNYEMIKSAKARSEAKRQADQINKLLQASAAAIVDIGKRLICVRESMTPTMFRAWIECEFRFQQPTAANYMQAARTFGELDCLENFQPSALIHLSRSNVPKGTIDAMIDQARSGDVVTWHTVRKALATNPSFVPTRSDAQIPRRPESSRSIANERALEFVPATSFASLQQSLDALAERLPHLTLSASDRDMLANRLIDLAFKLRSLACLPEAKTPRRITHEPDAGPISQARPRTSRKARDLVTA